MMTREEAIAEYERARIALYALRTQNADLLAALEEIAEQGAPWAANRARDAIAQAKGNQHSSD